MEQAETLYRLKSLHERIQSLNVRIEELADRIPFHLHPESLNYEHDLLHTTDEYNRLAVAALAGGVLERGALEAEGLPPQHGTGK